MRQTLRRIYQHLCNNRLPIVTGILIGTSYIPFPPWASFFAYVPLWMMWFEQGHKSKSLKSIFFTGWLAQFVLTFVGFNWVAHTAHEFGNFPWPLAILTLLLFCAVANLDLPISGLLCFYLFRKISFSPLQKLCILGIVTALLETWVPTLFPWNYGYPFLWIQSPMAQVGEIIGFQGLSSIIILLNILAFQLWHKRHSLLGRFNASHKWMISLLLTFVFLHFYGVYLKNRLPATDGQLRVLITQANIGNLQKQWAERGYAFREFIFEKYQKLTKEGLALQGPVDFVLWPETAYPYDMDQRYWAQEARFPGPAQKLISFSKEIKTHLITGGYGYSPRDGNVTNTFFIVDKKGEIQKNPYYKTTLLAFGEYIPFGDVFPKLYDWIPAGRFSRGGGPKPEELGDFKIGPQICYESLFPEFSRSLANEGIQVFVNITNDSWFGKWQEPHQHLFMTLARAVEFRRPLIRSTNTGISTAILSDGTVMQQSPLHTEWTGVFDIKYVSHPKATFYQKYPWLIQALLILSLALLLFYGTRKNGQKEI